MSEVITANEMTTANDNVGLASLPEDIQKRILEYSRQIQESSTISVSKIRLDAKSYIFPDQTETQTFTGVIVGVKHANIYYENEYEDGKISPPRCFAVGDVACASLSPHSKVVDPCGTTCETCEKFQWGSAIRGKGKACAELTLLAVYVPSLGDDLYYLEQKKANSRMADTYLFNISKKYGTPLAVLTEFSIGTKNKWEQNLVAVKPVNPEMIMTLVNRLDEATNMLESRITESYKRPEVEATSEEDTPDRPARSR